MANSNAGQALALTFANGPAGEALAPYLTNSSAGLDLALHLATSSFGLDLADSDASQALAVALANSPAGQALALALADSTAGRALARTVANSPTGLELAPSLDATDELLAAAALLRSLVPALGTWFGIYLMIGPMLVWYVAGVRTVVADADQREVEADEPDQVSPDDEAFLRQQLDTIKIQIDGSLADRALVERAIGHIVVRLAEIGAVGARARAVLEDLGGEPPDLIDAVVHALGQFTAAIAEFGDPDAYRNASDTADGAVVDMRTDLHGGQYRLTLDIGPSVTFGELAQVLADLHVLADVAAGWANLEAELGQEQAKEDQPGSVLAPPQVTTRFAGDDIRIENFSYRNPIEADIVAACTGGAALIGAFGALAKVLLDQRIEARKAAPETVLAAAQANKTLAEADKIRAETADIQLALYERALKLAAQAEVNATGEQIVAIIDAHSDDANAALERLAGNGLAIEPLPPTPDSNPEE